MTGYLPDDLSEDDPPEDMANWLMAAIVSGPAIPCPNCGAPDPIWTPAFYDGPTGVRHPDGGPEEMVYQSGAAVRSLQGDNGGHMKFQVASLLGKYFLLVDGQPKVISTASVAQTKPYWREYANAGRRDRAKWITVNKPGPEGSRIVAEMEYP